MKLKHLHYNLDIALRDVGEMRHPQVVMDELGIKYQHATPQSLFDCWQFWNCENVPDELPDYLQEKNIDPLDFVGYGLNQEMADAISKFTKNSGK